MASLSFRFPACATAEPHLRKPDRQLAAVRPKLIHPSRGARGPTSALGASSSRRSSSSHSGGSARRASSPMLLSIPSLLPKRAVQAFLLAATISTTALFAGVGAAFSTTAGGGEDPALGPRNVFDQQLATCSTNPMTGFFRDGRCETGPSDFGTHTVCAKVTQEFLEYTLQQGNDLLTPRPEYRFPGLKPGDGWCLCAARWHEALQAGVAPPVVLEATHKKTLAYVGMEDLQQHSAGPGVASE